MPLQVKCAHFTRCPCSSGPRLLQSNLRLQPHRCLDLNFSNTVTHSWSNELTTYNHHHRHRHSTADLDQQGTAPPSPHRDYASCGLDELSDLVKLRTGQKVAQNMSKHRLVEQLEEDDRKAGGSRFLDLPAEMRNRIYRELLILEPKQQVCRVGDVVRSSNELSKVCTDSDHRCEKRLCCHAAILCVNTQVRLKVGDVGTTPSAMAH